MIRSSTFRFALTLYTLLALPACRRMTGDESLAEDGADSLEASANEGSLLMVATDPTAVAFGWGPESPDGSLAAAAAAGAVEKYFQPPGCVTAVPDGMTVTYTFADCTGPHGLVHVTGILVVDFDRQADGLHVHATATGLHINGGTLSLDTTAVLSMTDAGKKLVVDTKKSGTGPRGRTFDHTGSYTFTWNAARCHTLDGMWSTTGAARSVSTTVSGYARCPGQCPSAGTITHTGALGNTITITLDGSSTAHWATSGGRSGTINMLCAGAS